MTQQKQRDWDRAPCAFFWEYKVAPEKAAEFEAFYGASGRWAQLYSRSDAFIRTELFRDPDDPTRYRTGDYWKSRDSFLEFLRDYSDPYDELGAECNEISQERTSAGMLLVEV
ncbi:antibiotic biosynthesis monooxygenase family protein [Hoeflea prorocentri]|uniref:Antibiotic biosynthesis monooxygenase n=1 Tax=Hoeflea prorocentri TaxID=1922333 RepID=A0A9X3UGX7_9HYPH|nr:antibiotic biosynthesis monooxygenase family protein [Hoeflea prorocentri]MCY6381122.1 antibiotic biosynthesis monooxygenase [Hoeflea prorocentri]MDA5398922.1 antibiotic biosynthesis monooxygenase [Hoeflea prorocentri]